MLLLLIKNSRKYFLRYAVKNWSICPCQEHSVEGILNYFTNTLSEA